MKRLLDAEYRRYVLRADINGHIVLPYVEYRKEYLLHNTLPDARIAAFREASAIHHAAQAERTLLRVQAGLPPLRRSNRVLVADTSKELSTAKRFLELEKMATKGLADALVREYKAALTK